MRAVPQSADRKDLSMGGYMGKLLVVDLTSGELKDEPIDPTMAHDFVGGRAMRPAICTTNWVRIPTLSDPTTP